MSTSITSRVLKPVGTAGTLFAFFLDVLRALALTLALTLGLALTRAMRFARSQVFQLANIFLVGSDLDRRALALCRTP